MDWTMIGAVGEILGAAGVIATLAYLAKQIRQSNVAARHEATREALDLNDRFLGELSRNPQVAGLYRRGLADDPDLTPDERMQLRALFLRMSLMWQRMYEYEGDRTLGVQSNARIEVAGAPGFRRWFVQRKHWLNADFRAQLEQEFAESPGFTIDWVPSQVDDVSAQAEQATAI